jgi:hypothetical protein
MAMLWTCSSLQALMHRTAISPLLAIKTLRMWLNEDASVDPMVTYKVEQEEKKTMKQHYVRTSLLRRPSTGLDIMNG